MRPLALLAVAVCASTLPAQNPVRVKLPAWSDFVLLDTMKAEHEVGGSPEVVYGALQKVLADFDIPKGNSDPKNGIIGSEIFQRSRILASAPMSRSFSCGESATGPRADSHRMTIALAAWVKPSAATRGGTTVSIAMAASGQDVGGVSKLPIECASTGFLEEKIVSAISKYAK